MKDGVRESECLLIFLSGRKETNGKPDSNGLYEGPFTRWFCHEEMAAARENGIVVVGCQEEDEGRNKPDRALEKSRAHSGGTDGGPVHETHVEANLRYLDDICFSPFRRARHEVQPMIDEIARQARPQYDVR